MDINKENKITEETETSKEETVKAEETVAEENDIEITIEDESTLSVSMEDIDEELMRYGIEADEECDEYEYEYDFDSYKKKGTVQKPILIAALAFLLTAVVVFGTYFIYNIFVPNGVEGTWIQSGSEDNPSMYLKFDDGTVSIDFGGFESYGYYETEEINGKEVIITDFYGLVVVGQSRASNNIIVEFSEDNKTMTLNFLYYGVDLKSIDLNTTGLDDIKMGSINFIRGKAPKNSVNPEEITHASADEFGITAVNVDENIVGSWRLAVDGIDNKYKTYTFNDDGTGSYEIDYIYYEGYALGVGEKYQFRYTVYEDNILITDVYYSGTTSDQSIKYYIDNGNLVLDGVGFEKVN